MDEKFAAAHENALNLIDLSCSVGESLSILRSAFWGTHFTYHLSQTVADSFDAPFVRTTYPDAWVSRYLLQSYIYVDPIVREGLTRLLPFDWRDMAVNSQVERFFADARSHGIGGNGYTVPIIDKAHRRALLSVNSALGEEDWERFLTANRDPWILTSQVIHRKAINEIYGDVDPVPLLSPREIECLHWTALGKDNKDIATILTLSEHTVRDYLKSAKLKLGCATLAAATTRATHLKIINPWTLSAPQNDGSR